MIKAFVWIRPRKKLREASAFRGAGFPPIYGVRGLMVLRVFPFFFPLYFLPDFPYFHFIIFHPLYFLSQSIIPPFFISSPNFITSSLIPPHFTPQIQALPPLGVYETRLRKIEVGNGGLFSVTSFRIHGCLSFDYLSLIFSPCFKVGLISHASVCLCNVSPSCGLAI